MARNIDVDAEIDSIRLTEQGSVPASPSAGYSHIYAMADGLYLVNDSDEEIGPFITGTSPVAGSWQITFFATSNEPPSSSYATLDTVNSRPVLDHATGESSVFADVLHPDYSNAGVNLRIGWSATGSSGDAYFQVAMERIVTGTTDLDTDSFATAVNGSSANAAGRTLGLATLSLSNGAEMDNTVAGDYFRLQFTYVSGTFLEDFELHFIEMVEQ